MFLTPLPSCALKPLVPASLPPAPPRSPLTPHGCHWAAASLHHLTRQQHSAPQPLSPWCSSLHAGRSTVSRVPSGPGPRSPPQCRVDPAQSLTLSCLNCLSIPSQSHGFQHHPDAPQACWPSPPAGTHRDLKLNSPPGPCIPPQPVASSCRQLGLSSCSDQRPWGCQDPSLPHIPNAQNIFSIEV